MRQISFHGRNKSEVPSRRRFESVTSFSPFKRDLDLLKKYHFLRLWCFIDTTKNSVWDDYKDMEMTKQMTPSCLGPV